MKEIAGAIAGIVLFILFVYVTVYRLRSGAAGARQLFRWTSEKMAEGMHPCANCGRTLMAKTRKCPWCGVRAR